MSEENRSHNNNNISQLSNGSEDQVPFIQQWCLKYGLARVTADTLQQEGIHSTEHLLMLNTDMLQDLKISLGQRCLLRGALLQFKDSDLKYAAFRAKKTDPQKAMELERLHKGQTRKMERGILYYTFLY